MQALRQLRLARGMSQRELAAASGVGRDTISGLEKGERQARPSTTEKLALALSVTPAQLTGGMDLSGIEYKLRHIRELFIECQEELLQLDQLLTELERSNNR